MANPVLEHLGLVSFWTSSVALYVEHNTALVHRKEYNFSTNGSFAIFGLKGRKGTHLDEFYRKSSSL